MGRAARTLDIDLSVWIASEEFEHAVRTITAEFRSVPEALAFARRTRVLPIATASGVRADIVFAALKEERDFISRAITKQVGDVSIRVAAIEDLIYMKLVSERPRDAEDARRLIRRFRTALDRNYLEPRLQQIGEALARPDIIEAFRREMA